MDCTKKIHDYVTEHREEILNTLKELVGCPSVRGEAERNAPFGKECAAALELTESLYAENGFETRLEKDGGYLLSYYGSGEKSIGLFAHADVVAVNDDWVHTAPFEPLEKDGYLIGRGVLDDKSAVVISLYCAKMLKELEIPFASRLVMFTGSNEESGMADMDAYVKKHTPPDFSLVCDTAFPLYRGDKSGMNAWITFDEELRDVCDFHGGKAMNVTLGKAYATVNGELLTKDGVSRHSALPEGSVNAGYLLAEELVGRTDVCEADKKQLRLVAKILGTHYGEAFGIEHTDADFGRLTCTNGVIKTENGRLTLGVNLRFGLSVDTEELRRKMSDFCAENGCKIVFEEEKRGYVVSENDPYVRACLKAYKEYTGDETPAVYINAGGTYARKLPRAAEIGTTLRWGVPNGTTAGHGGAHQADECLNIEGFFEALELTLHMLLACDETEEQRL